MVIKFCSHVGDDSGPQEWTAVFHEAFKIGTDILDAPDPLEAAVEVIGKKVLGKLLSDSHCSQVAGFVDIHTCTLSAYMQASMHAFM